MDSGGVQHWGLGDNDQNTRKNKGGERCCLTDEQGQTEAKYREETPSPPPPLPHVVTKGTWGATASPTNAATYIATGPMLSRILQAIGALLHCYEVGQMKANYPKLRRPQYPFYSRHDIAIDSVVGR